MSRAKMADARALAIRRRAMKRWLHQHGIRFSERARYSESGLRKLVRDATQTALKAEDPKR